MPDRCTATSKRTGEQCRRRPIRGATVCDVHGGKAPQVLAKATQRILETRLAGEVQRRGWSPVTDPAAALLDVAGETLTWLALCRDQVTTLHSLEATGMLGALDVRPIVALYERAQDRATGVLAKLVSLGIQARVARSQELTAEANLAVLRTLIRQARETDTPEDQLILAALTD